MKLLGETMMKTIAVTLLIAFALLMLTGCSKEKPPQYAGSVAKAVSPENARTAEHEAAADVRVTMVGDTPIIVATARIPLDDSATTVYFLALDGSSFYGDLGDYVLPRKPPETKYRFGIARMQVPFDALDEQVNNQAAEASLKKDIATLERIAGSLRGRVSFFYETSTAAYDE